MGRDTGREREPLDGTMDVKVFSHDCLSWSEMAFPSTGQALKNYLRKF